jgi:hypothetical protein
MFPDFDIDMQFANPSVTRLKIPMAGLVAVGW